MNERNNQPPKQPDPSTIEQQISRRDGPNASPNRSIAGEITTADHERAALKAQQTSASKSDGKGIGGGELPPITPTFNNPPEPPKKPGITPKFNAEAKAPKKPAPAEPELNHNPPAPGGGGGGGSKTSPQLGTPTNAAAFKAKMAARQAFNRAARGLDRER